MNKTPRPLSVTAQVIALQHAGDELDNALSALSAFLSEDANIEAGELYSLPLIQKEDEDRIDDEIAVVPVRYHSRNDNVFAKQLAQTYPRLRVESHTESTRRVPRFPGFVLIHPDHRDVVMAKVDVVNLCKAKFKDAALQITDTQLRHEVLHEAFGNKFVTLMAYRQVPVFLGDMTDVAVKFNWSTAKYNSDPKSLTQAKRLVSHHLPSLSPDEVSRAGALLHKLGELKGEAGDIRRYRENRTQPLVWLSRKQTTQPVYHSTSVLPLICFGLASRLREGRPLGAYYRSVHHKPIRFPENTTPIAPSLGLFVKGHYPLL